MTPPVERGGYKGATPAAPKKIGSNDAGMADYDCCLRFVAQFRHVHFYTDGKHEQADPNWLKSLSAPRDEVAKTN